VWASRLEYVLALEVAEDSSDRFAGCPDKITGHIALFQQEPRELCRCRCRQAKRSHLFVPSNPVTTQLQYNVLIRGGVP